MNIAVLGTGIVGRTLASSLVEIGHTVMVGTRDPAKTLAKTEPERHGGPPFSVWLKQNGQVRLGALSEAASHGAMVFNAVKGVNTLEALALVGETNLNGKILVDISNPLDYSKGRPPSLSVSSTDSLAEQIQRAYPAAKVVKTLNTVNVALMVNPRRLAGGGHTLFVSGNDPQAKASVTALLRSLGWQDIIDLGDISTARGTEMLLPVWLSLRSLLQTPVFNFKVVR